MRVTSILSLALVIVFRPCTSDEVLSPQSCFTDPIAAWYDGSGLTASQWTDKSGNDFHASFPNTVPLLFDDADASNELYLNGEPVLYGDTSTTVLFPDDLIVGKEHTIFNACKYQEGGTEGRILQSQTITAFFGFHSGRSGLAFESGWMTEKTVDFGTEWVLSSQSSPFYRANGIDFTIASGIADAIGTLAINNANDYSDWACAEILIINAELSEEEVECVENTYFNCKYGEGFGDGVCEATTASPTTASPTEVERDCDQFNIDGFLNECSADFSAEKEALEAVEVRVITLESDTATTDAAVAGLSADLLTLQSEAATSEDLAATDANLAATDVAVEAVTADLSSFETATNTNLAATDATVQALSADLSTLDSETATSLAATDAAVEALSADLSTLEGNTATNANLAATDVAVGEVSIRVSNMEETLLGFSSARTATAQFDTLPANTGTSLLFGDKDLLIVISLAVNTVLLMALLAVLCRSGKGYKAVGTFAESDSEMAELQ